MTYNFSNRNIKKRRPAFSLAEAMITLLMVSIVMAAMAPLMTKKMKLTQTGFSSTLGGKEMTPVLFTEAGAVQEFAVPAGKTSFQVSVQGAGGGGAGATSIAVQQLLRKTNNSAEQQFDLGTITGTATTTTYTVPDGVTQVAVELVGAGGGGGAGNGAGGGSGTDEFLVKGGADGGGDLCVKKYNIGTYSSEIRPSTSVYLRQAGSGSDWRSGTSSDQRCWTTNTSLTSGSSSAYTANPSYCGTSYSPADSGGLSSTSYSGCYRTVCTQPAATASCSAIGWRLPTVAEMQRWRNTPGSDSPFKTAYKGSSGMDLCDGNSSGCGSAYCNYYGNCSGSTGGNCYASFLWPSTSLVYYLYYGSLNYAGDYTPSYAF